MDKDPIACVDADMATLGRTHAEEQQIARYQVLAPRCARMPPLQPGRAGHLDAGLAMAVLHQTAAVEAPPVAAAISIGRADLLRGDPDDLATLRRDDLSVRSERGVARRQRRAAAASQAERGDTQ